MDSVLAGMQVETGLVAFDHVLKACGEAEAGRFDDGNRVEESKCSNLICGDGGDDA